MKFDKLIVKPVITEKSAFLGGDQKYQFIVNRNANKIEIKQALEALYGEPVATVRTSYIRPKTRRVNRGTMEKRHEQKKVTVTFKGRKEIDVNKFKEKKKK